MSSIWLKARHRQLTTGQISSLVVRVGTVCEGNRRKLERKKSKKSRKHTIQWKMYVYSTCIVKSNPQPNEVLPYKTLGFCFVFPLAEEYDPVRPCNCIQPYSSSSSPSPSNRLSTFRTSLHSLFLTSKEKRSFLFHLGEFIHGTQFFLHDTIIPTTAAALSKMKNNNKKQSSRTNNKKNKKKERKTNVSVVAFAVDTDPATLSSKASTSTSTNVLLLESEEQRKRIEHDVLECVLSPKSSSTSSTAAKRLYRSMDIPLFMKVYRGHMSNIREYLDSIRIIDNDTTSGTVPDIDDGNSSVTKPAASPSSRCNHLSHSRLFHKNGTTSIPLYIQMNLARCLATCEIKTHELEMQQQKQQHSARRTSSSISSRSRSASYTTTSSTEKIQVFNNMMMDAFMATGSGFHNIDSVAVVDDGDEKIDIETYRSLCLALATHACLNNCNDFAHLMVLFVLFFDTWKKYGGDVHGGNQDRKMAGLELLRKKSRYLTDRGVISFVHKRNPCRCLSAMNKQAKLNLPDNRLCFRCQTPVKATTIFECSMCQTGLYCSEDCQSRDWSQHKVDCKCYAKLSATADMDDDNDDEIPDYEKENYVEKTAATDRC